MMAEQSSVSYTLREMRREDLPRIFEMLDEETWIMEKAYLQCAYDTDSTGFIVAVTDDGEVIGSLGSLSHGDDVVCVGLLLVKKGYRHLDIGTQMYRKLREQLGNQNMGYFVWPQHQDVLKKKHKVDVKTTYMTWHNFGEVNLNTFKVSAKEDFKIMSTKDVSMDELLRYDSTIHTIPREGYMKRWLQHESSRAYVAKRNDKIVGYGILRSQDNYNQIAPLYADDKYVANALFRKLASELPKYSKLGFSCPFENNSALTLAAKNGMLKPGFPLIRVYERKAVQIDTSKVYSVSSNSFGIC